MTAIASIKVGDGSAVPVQFNPASLRVTTTNQLEDEHPNQVSKPTAFKLDVELLFDSTHDGTDIYQKTRAIRDAASATAQGATAANSGSGSGGNSRSGTTPSSLSLVTFSWGTTHYQGYIESLNETLDYWSSDGVPLRSTLQISLKGKADNFLTGTYSNIANYTTNPAPALPAIVTTSTAVDQARFTRAAGAGGDLSTGRGLAGLNGVENMRAGAFAGASASAGAFAGAGGAGAFAGAGASAGASAGAGAGIAAGAGAQLQAAASFKLAGGVSAGASAGFGIGASAGLSAGAGLGASVGVGMAAGAGIGIGGGISAGAGIGIGASAGIGMSAGASFGAGASAGFGMGASASAGIGIGASGGGFGVTTSTSVTGFDGVTRTTTTHSGSGSAGMTASAGAFAGLGSSRTTLPGTGFNPDALLPPPLPGGGATTRYDVSGRAVSSGGQVGASWSAQAGVTVW